jgi:hypothetical protein
MPCNRPTIGQSSQKQPRVEALGCHVSVLTKKGTTERARAFPRKARASEESEHAIKTSATARDSIRASQSEPVC